MKGLCFSFCTLFLLGGVFCMKYSHKLQNVYEDPIFKLLCNISTNTSAFYFAHPDNCQYFIKCVHEKPYEIECPSKLAWNQFKMECVKDKAKCLTLWDYPKLMMQIQESLKTISKFDYLTASDRQAIKATSKKLNLKLKEYSANINDIKNETNTTTTVATNTTIKTHLNNTDQNSEVHRQSTKGSTISILKENSIPKQSKIENVNENHKKNENKTEHTKKPRLNDARKQSESNGGVNASRSSVPVNVKSEDQNSKVNHQSTKGSTISILKENSIPKQSKIENVNENHKKNENKTEHTKKPRLNDARKQSESNGGVNASRSSVPVNVKSEDQNSEVNHQSTKGSTISILKENSIPKQSKIENVNENHKKNENKTEHTKKPRLNDARKQSESNGGVNASRSSVPVNVKSEEFTKSNSALERLVTTLLEKLNLTVFYKPHFNIVWPTVPKTTSATQTAITLTNTTNNATATTTIPTTNIYNTTTEQSAVGKLYGWFTDVASDIIVKSLNKWHADTPQKHPSIRKKSRKRKNRKNQSPRYINDKKYGKHQPSNSVAKNSWKPLRNKQIKLVPSITLDKHDTPTIESNEISTKNLHYASRGSKVSENEKITTHNKNLPSSSTILETTTRESTSPTLENQIPEPIESENKNEKKSLHNITQDNYDFPNNSDIKMIKSDNDKGNLADLKNIIEVVLRDTLHDLMNGNKTLESSLKTLEKRTNKKRKSLSSVTSEEQDAPPDDASDSNEIPTYNLQDASRFKAKEGNIIQYEKIAADDENLQSSNIRTEYTPDDPIIDNLLQNSFTKNLKNRRTGKRKSTPSATPEKYNPVVVEPNKIPNYNSKKYGPVIKAKAGNTDIDEMIATYNNNVQIKSMDLKEILKDSLREVMPDAIKNGMLSIGNALFQPYKDLIENLINQKQYIPEFSTPQSIILSNKSSTDPMLIQTLNTERNDLTLPLKHQKGLITDLLQYASQYEPHNKISRNQSNLIALVQLPSNNKFPEVQRSWPTKNRIIHLQIINNDKATSESNNLK